MKSVTFIEHFKKKYIVPLENLSMWVHMYHKDSNLKASELLYAYKIFSDDLWIMLILMYTM